MGSYVKHVSRERARLRHPAFGQAEARKIALDVLQRQPGLAGIKPGPESFLLFLEPEASLDQICGELDSALPELGKTQATRPGRRWRKDVLKAYLATGITTVALAAFGPHHWHALCGSVFTAFAVNHVWERRKAL